jgi:hypothetical protein
VTQPTSYTNCRDAIRSGDLLAFSHRRWRSWTDWKIQGVRLAQQSEYAHVGIAVVFGKRIWVIEAVKPVVRIVPLSLLLPAYWIHMSVDWTEEVDTYAMSFIGKAFYSEWEAVMAFIGLNSRDNDAWECGELVKAIYHKCGIILPGRDIPADIMNDVLQQGKGMVLLTKDNT